MELFVDKLLQFGRILLGAVILITGTFGLFINFHDIFFLIVNVCFLVVGLFLFLEINPAKTQSR
ncbi:hypothetical protein [Thioflexithrix psekupsensis]|uniref:Uncharacterized protein n=1 Tax=Thioflexithrix psekupsensis TaxID=1570016 RepID=A0A251XD65_9GAMM|nr:hypothetical protein [Thioflexithrix psekupsensis]OUD16315.1 hypothetical protein TPSD3_00920 [Thioflexithrix psekupsensis]